MELTITVCHRVLDRFDNTNPVGDFWNSQVVNLSECLQNVMELQP